MPPTLLPSLPSLTCAALCCALLALPARACPDLGPADAATLSLDKALARVTDCHPELRGQRALLAAADADVRVAGQLPNPQLTVGAGSLSRNLGRGSLWNKTFDHSLRIDQLIEGGRKPALRRAVAESTRQAVLADVADAQRRAAAVVAHLHQDLWAAQSRDQQLEQSVALSSQALRLLEQRVRAGDAPALDASRFRLDDARLRADLRQAQAEAFDLQRQLALSIGATPVAGQLQAQAHDPAAWPVAQNDMPGDLASDAATQAADRRPDVAAALARVRAAEQARDLAAAARTRDISVGAQFNRYPSSDSNPSGSGNTVSFSISVPLFVRHANDGELARAEADLNIAREAWRRSRDAVLSEGTRLQALAVAAQDRRRLVLAQLEPAAERVAAGAELAYQRGASGALELLEARRSLRAVRIERINADAELNKALADWQAATAPVEATDPPTDPTQHNRARP